MKEGRYLHQLTIPSNFRSGIGGSPREKAMYEYINLIVTLSLPISFIENETVRSFCKSDVRLSYRVLRDTIYKLVEIVETYIKDEMKDTRGAVMHDSWTNNSTHYLAIIAVYVKKTKK